jgi:hypothetical protein
MSYSVSCPEEKDSRYEPTKTWESKLPSGESITYGIIPKHFHLVMSYLGAMQSDTPCEYGGLVGRVTKRDLDPIPHLIIP